MTPSPRLATLLSALLVVVQVALTAPPAAAGITPEARRVVERYLEAIGGRALQDSMRTLRVAGAVSAFGLHGRAIAWHARPDRSATEIELGPFKIAEGFDGTAGWRTDPSGKLVMLDGKDLEDTRASAWFENDRWLEPDQGGGAVSAAGAERDSAGTYAVLEVAPPVGRPRRLWFDDRTGLLGRSVSRKDQQTVSFINSDFRRVGGRTIAFRSLTRFEGMPANDLVLELDSIAVNVDVPRSRFAAPMAAGTGLRWLRTPGQARLPFEYASRHVWLKVSVNGAPPADFLFDTGASITVLDSTYAARLGIATVGHQQGVGAGAVGNASFATVQTLRAAAPDSDGVELADVQVAVLGLKGFLEPYFWRDIAGVVGFDFIQRFVDRIDYDHRVLTLEDPQDFHYSGNGAAIPMTLAGTTPVVKLTLDGSIEGLYRVDVGSGSTVDLHTPFVKQHRLLETAGAKVEITGGGFGGTFLSTARRMARLEIGPYGWAEPIVALSAATRGAFTSEDYAGNLGNQILQRFTCTLDYERRVLYLEPGARYSEPDEFPRSGLQLARFGDRVVAYAVLAGSPAERAGVREQDEVVSIDGKPARDWTPDTLYEAIDRGHPGDRHTLEVERDGERRKLTLVLRDLL
jgi:hypothetical protein